MSLSDHISYDGELIDEIRIRVIPHCKPSGDSGDEYRVRGVVEIYRNGDFVAERFLTHIGGDIEEALRFIIGGAPIPEPQNKIDAEKILQEKEGGQ